MGRNLLNSGFEDFLNGSGVWIVVGVLAATFVVSMVFLILNILKDKKAAKEAAEKQEGQAKEEEPKQEEIKEVKAEDLEEKPKKKRKVKKDDKQEEKTEEEQENPVKEEKVEEPKEEVKEEKPKAKKQPKKAAAKEEEKPAEETKEEPAKEEEAEMKKEEKKATYGVTYDKEKREWVVKKSGSARASKRCTTKAEALEVAEKLSEASGANLRVHKKNGKFQKI